MRWEIEHPTTPELGEIRFLTRFAFLPTRVLSKITMTDHLIWLEFYVEEQEYKRIVDFELPTAFEDRWVTVAKTIHT
jgi:hypothetical protein